MDIWEHWDSRLGSPKFVTAPMVDMSELPFRMLTRKYGSNLCFTPMYHSARFAREPKYRKDFTTNQQDSPLIVQFCSNNANDFTLAASQITERECDGIDLNLGCPQKIAKRGHYGAYLLNSSQDMCLVSDMIKMGARNTPHAMSAKIRIFKDDYHKTFQYARMLIDSGCKFLTIHARDLDQKGPNTGLADWSIIQRLKQEPTISVPIIANGNVITREDAITCLETTCADAVMSAEAILQNPALFNTTTSSSAITVWQMGQQFLQFCETYPIPINHIRAHLFKIFHLCLPLLPLTRELLCQANSISDFHHLILTLKSAFEPISCDLDFVRINFNHIDVIGVPLEVNGDDNCSMHIENGYCGEADINNWLKQRILLQNRNRLAGLSPYIIANDCNENGLLKSNSVETNHIEKKNNNLKSNYYTQILIPPWICHSVPRVW